jgi:hypothetical protein
VSLAELLNPQTIGSALGGAIGAGIAAWAAYRGGFLKEQRRVAREEARDVAGAVIRKHVANLHS